MRNVKFGIEVGENGFWVNRLVQVDEAENGEPIFKGSNLFRETLQSAVQEVRVSLDNLLASEKKFADKQAQSKQR